MVQALPPKSTAIKICRSPQLQTLGAGRLLHNLFNGERPGGMCAAIWWTVTHHCGWMIELYHVTSPSSKKKNWENHDIVMNVK